jgi:hypothetical protein
VHKLYQKIDPNFWNLTKTCFTIFGFLHYFILILQVHSIIRKGKLIYFTGTEKGPAPVIQPSSPTWGAAARSNRPNNGPRRGKARTRATKLQKRARALRKTSDAASYCFYRLELRTKHPGKSCLCNGVVPGVPARGGAAPAGTRR